VLKSSFEGTEGNRVAGCPPLRVVIAAYRHRGVIAREYRKNDKKSYRFVFFLVSLYYSEYHALPTACLGGVADWSRADGRPLDEGSRPGAILLLFFCYSFENSLNCLFYDLISSFS